MKKGHDSMQQQLQNTVKDLRDRGVDFSKEHPLFKWSYPDDPNIEFQLLIMEHVAPETSEMTIH